MTTFQGKPVHGTKIALTGGAKEFFLALPKIDDIVNVEIFGRVTGYVHAVNETTGELELTVRIKAMEINDVTTVSTSGGVTDADGRVVDPDTGEVLSA